ncbi:MAG TPA: MdtA/MuxA family multidrug efflux RND transporter periplasmic adaptor subunit [Myxococcota bacterium]|nr:MdtA/MuxA family multidrug efflux RND transporter periplasmic adaptor subunit [Myxococcota bacterium]
MSERPLTLPSRWPGSLAAVAGLLALLVAAGIFALVRSRSSASGPGAGAAGARAVPVLATAAHTGDMPVYVTGLGSVTALNTVTVKSRVDGQLMHVAFKEGDVVKKGQLLAVIDERPARAALTAAKGQLAHDQALLANAKLDLQRYKELFKQDSVAKQQLDTQAALVRQYEGTVEVDRGNVDNAQVQLDYCRITAPLAGRLGLRLVDAGNVIHATDPNGLVVITQVQPIAVLFTVPEDQVPAVVAKLGAGEHPQVEALDRDGTRTLAKGTLLTTDNQIDPATGTVRLKAIFPNEDGSLFPNQFVNARLLLDLRKDATIVPTAAVQRGADGTFAYVVKPDQTVETRILKVGLVDGERTSVDKGVSPGELVVVEGATLLREGSRVELKTDTPPASAAAPPP